MMVDNILIGILLIWNAANLFQLAKLRYALELPVMSTSLNWALVGGLLLELAIFMSIPQIESSRSWQDQYWYWTAVILCCPLISILGSRRPTSRVWNSFIILPLIAVLGWPAITVLIQSPDIYPVEVQMPVLIGFALVILMGAGNYQGTRYAFSVLLIAGGQGMILWSVSTFANSGPLSIGTTRLFSSLSIVLGTTFGLWQSHRPTVEESPFDRLWFDFRDLFGIVWSIRIQERLNVTAEKEGWHARLEPEGFKWETRLTDHQRRETEARLIRSLYWHLRRFVENEWIEERLGVPCPESLTSSPTTKK